MGSQFKLRVCVQTRSHWQVVDFHGSGRKFQLAQRARIARRNDFDLADILAVEGDFAMLAYCLHPHSLPIVEMPTRDLPCARDLAQFMLPLAADNARVHWRMGRNSVQAYCFPEYRINELEKQLAHKSLRLVGVSDYASALLQLSPAKRRSYYYHEDLLIYIDKVAQSIDCHYPLSLEAARELVAELGADCHFQQSLVDNSRLLPPPKFCSGDGSIYSENILALGMLQPIMN